MLLGDIIERTPLHSSGCMTRKLGVSDDLAEVEGVTPELLVALGEYGVKTRDDLADLAGDELMEFAPEGILNETKANAIIMAARAHWFEDDDTKEAGAEDAPEEAEGEAPGETEVKTEVKTEEEAGGEDEKPADG